MKIQISQRDLSKHINIAQKGISSRSTLPILSGILLETEEGRLKLTSTDLEISIETYVDCQIEREGSIVINSRIFGDIVRKLPDSTIYIDVDEERNMNIKCENSEFNILGQDPEEYPNLPIVVKNQDFRIPKDIFKSAIRQTVFATSEDETRPILTGVLMEITEGDISFVALDGYRLALKRIDMSSEIEEKIAMVIPGRALSEVNKIIEDDEEDIIITSAPGNIIFNLGSTKMYSRLLEGQFFNYRDIIRQDHETTFLVDKRKLQNSLERASLLAKEEKANLIKLSVANGRISIMSNSEIGDVHEEIPIDIEGEDVDIAFNSRYLLEGIRVIDADEIRLNFMGSLNPCIINPVEEEDYIYLVLPVRLARDN